MARLPFRNGSKEFICFTNTTEVRDLFFQFNGFLLLGKSSGCNGGGSGGGGASGTFSIHSLRIPLPELPPSLNGTACT